MKKFFVLFVLLLSMVGLTNAQKRDIDVVYLNGFTEPAWGEHPDFDLEVPDDANYTILNVSWYCERPGRTAVELTPDSIFNHADGAYYMSFVLDANDNTGFSPTQFGISVYINGDPNLADNAALCSIGLYELDRCCGYTNNFYVTEPGPNPGSNGYNFDDGTLQGWTTIDADGDGYNWFSQYDDLNYVGHNGSEGFLATESWHDQVVLTPDNYVVSPEKKQYEQVKFWACAQDEAYPEEHFGVAVSTASATNPDDFTTIQEWTMTAKQGDWHEYTVDLSAYAGQEIWVAIRHFNCTDQFILLVDDIEFTVDDGPILLEFTLTVTCDPAQGQVTGNGTYVAGSEVSVEAIPNEGFVFDHWNDNVTDNPRRVIMNENIDLEAFFKQTGVDEEGVALMHIHPNPAKETLHIEGLEVDTEVQIYNNLGALVKTVNVGAEQEIDVSHLPVGLYFVRCGRQSLRFVKE